ncbi:MAG: hypothetical protein U0744_18410 [Gemmataceae bacterium]
MLEVLESIKIIEQGLKKPTLRSGRRRPPLRRTRQEESRRPDAGGRKKEMEVLNKAFAAGLGHRVELPKHRIPAKRMWKPNAPRPNGLPTSSATRELVPSASRVHRASRTWSTTNPSAPAALIADVPAIVGSIDIVMGEIDR